MKSPCEGARETVKQTAIHPGEVLADGLQALSMSGATLARELNEPTDHIVGILGGQGAITGDTACAWRIVSARARDSG